MILEYEIINLKTNKSHGIFSTLEGARARVKRDRIKDWEIWEQGAHVVAYRDTGVAKKDSRDMKLTKPQLRLILKKLTGHLSPKEKKQMAALRQLIEDYLANRAKCEECGTELTPFAGNGKSGLSCDTCGWTWDD